MTVKSIQDIIDNPHHHVDNIAYLIKNPKAILELILKNQVKIVMAQVNRFTPEDAAKLFVNAQQQEYALINTLGDHSRIEVIESLVKLLSANQEAEHPTVLDHEIKEGCPGTVTTSPSNSVNALESILMRPYSDKELPIRQKLLDLFVDSISPQTANQALKMTILKLKPDEPLMQKIRAKTKIDQSPPPQASPASSPVFNQEPVATPEPEAKTQPTGQLMFMMNLLVAQNQEFSAKLELMIEQLKEVTSNSRSSKGYEQEIARLKKTTQDQAKTIQELKKALDEEKPELVHKKWQGLKI